MSHEKTLFEPSQYEPGTNGLLSKFDPGTQILPTGYQVAPEGACQKRVLSVPLAADSPAGSERR